MAKKSSKTVVKRPRLMKAMDRERLRDIIGKNIRRTRLAKGLSPTQFETFSGIEPRNLRRYETGERMPGIPTIIIIAKALGVKHWELVKFEFDWGEKWQSK